MLTELDEKVNKFNLKVQLLVHNSEEVAQLQTQVLFQDVEWTAIRMTTTRSTRASEAITRTYASLWTELDALHDAEDIKKVCSWTSYREFVLATVS